MREGGRGVDGGGGGGGGGVGFCALHYSMTSTLTIVIATLRAVPYFLCAVIKIYHEIRI